MKAINIQVDAAEKGKMESFIKSINANEEVAACSAGEAAVCIAAIGECGIAYAKALAAQVFDNEVEVAVIK